MDNAEDVCSEPPDINVQDSEPPEEESKRDFDVKIDIDSFEGFSGRIGDLKKENGSDFKLPTKANRDGSPKNHGFGN